MIQKIPKIQWGGELIPIPLLGTPVHFSGCRQLLFRFHETYNWLGRKIPKFSRSTVVDR